MAATRFVEGVASTSASALLKKVKTLTANAKGDNNEVGVDAFTAELPGVKMAEDK